MRSFLAPAAVAALSFISADTALALGCSEGQWFADGVVTPSKTMGNVTSATQYAWDGGTSIVETCNLTTEGNDFSAIWRLYSGEVDATHPGICIMLTNDQGNNWYSCVPPATVGAANGAGQDDPAFTLRFSNWMDSVGG
ncbi:hypothetical protein JI664_20980 [Rhodobacter sp. NTK016B]|uniref:hypothetical protein n=1 Tax=Rhodobacter sp. NTK016B TaxID=2759676 RepID=UPI001A8D08FA|nr:hypothetical protein [Rhodobacter sp. NTK016B]MBN8294460.1 hypothetical protein [Rhodobacter sp. NTK016B]